LALEDKEMSPDVIMSAWDEYRRDELPPNTPPALLIEHKRTFLAAFHTAQELFTLASSAAPNVDKVEMGYRKGHAYVIDKNIDLPKSDPKYPFDEMEIGHSFKLDGVTSADDQLYKRVSVACSLWNKAHPACGKRLTIRKRLLSKGKRFEYRCYMIEPEEAE
jgi:hypothetical protein